jgi:tRNA nucleotidyltransferase/poly(A) polymerase
MLIESLVIEVFDKILEAGSQLPIKRKMLIPLPDDLLGISGLFKASGKQFYLVGGSVRDALMGEKPKDYDMATDATPDEITQILKQNQTFKILDIGKAFGVIKVLTPQGNEYEIATFRRDVGQGRRPDSVEFTSIDQDVQRRDLSLNALFYDIENKEVVDYVGGIADIENKIVRTVGSPQDRFEEDKLRILRAIRFAARLGSGLDKATSEAIKSNNSLEGVSGERIRDEFIKGIKSAKSTTLFYNLLSEHNLWEQIFPGLAVARDFKEIKNVPVAVAVLLRENPAKVLLKKLNDLKYSSDEVNQISFLVTFQGLDVTTAYKLKKLFKISKLQDKDFVEFSSLTGRPQSSLVQAFIKYEPSITGIELQSQGFSGKELGQELERRETEIFRRMM